MCSLFSYFEFKNLIAACEKLYSSSQWINKLYISYSIEEPSEVRGIRDPKPISLSSSVKTERQKPLCLILSLRGE